MNSNANTKPNSLIGVGLRHSHYSEALSSVSASPDGSNSDSTSVDFVEVHAENFFAAGGATHSLIHDIADRYPLSIHGTSLGLGSVLPVPKDVLQQFSALVKSTQPMLVSEHLCFNRAQVNGTILHSGDLLPIPYNTASLKTIVAHIQQVQESIQRPLLIENLSAYISPSKVISNRNIPISDQLEGQSGAEREDEIIAQLAAQAPHSVHNNDDMTEFEFLNNMCEAAGCGLLLDLNNLIINELNLKTPKPLDAIQQRLKTLPAHIVGEIHLAGFTEQLPVSNSSRASAEQPHFIIDDHGAPVSEQCWALYYYALQLFPGTPTLVEWDTQIPEWSVLVNEASKARAIARQVVTGADGLLLRAHD